MACCGAGSLPPMRRRATVLVLSASVLGFGCFTDVTALPCAPGTVGCECNEAQCAPGLVCVGNLCESFDSTSGSSAAGPVTSDSDSTSGSVTSSTTEPTSSTSPVTSEGSSTQGTATGATSTSDSGSTTDSIAPQTIFVTSDSFVGGDLASVAQADQRCTDAMSDGRTWQAILYDSATAPADRITVTGPVHNMVDELVASDAQELWSGMLISDVGYDEFGNEMQGQLAWVGSMLDNCGDWTMANLDLAAPFGVPTQADLWLGGGSGMTFQCDLPLHLYCISAPT